MTYSYIGVDTGQAGYLVIVRAGVVVWQYPIDNNYSTLLYAMREAEVTGPPQRMLIEEPLTFMPKGKGGNTRQKGNTDRQRAYGALWGMAMAMGISSVRSVHPATWRAFYKFPRKTDKAIHIAKAIELFPQYRDRTITDGLADSLLIAHYASKVWDTKYIRSTR